MAATNATAQIGQSALFTASSAARPPLQRNCCQTPYGEPAPSPTLSPRCFCSCLCCIPPGVVVVLVRISDGSHTVLRGLCRIYTLATPGHRPERAPPTTHSVPVCHHRDRTRPRHALAALRPVDLFWATVLRRPTIQRNRRATLNIPGGLRPLTSVS
jgi:hypothetical protein